MNEVSPEVAALARRLILFETHTSDRVDAVVDAGERAWGRLERHLTALIGPAGFAALSVRALALARPRHPVLAGFSYGAVQGERLAGLRTPAPEYAPPAVRDALDALVAHFLAVFVRLIGAELVLRLVREAWPELPPGDVVLSLETDA